MKGLEDTKRKWKKCHTFRDDILYGTIAILSGCVIFWNMKRYLPKDSTPRRFASAINYLLKGIGIGLYIKGIVDYKECD